MGWADSATGGGYGGGSDSSSDRDNDTDTGGYSRGFGAEVDTGGVARGGGSQTSARSSQSNGTGSASTGDAAADSGYSRGFARDVAATPSQSISSGSIASMDEMAAQAEKSFLDRTSLETYTGMQRDYNPSANLSRAESMVETIAQRTDRKPGQVGDMIGRENFGQMTDGDLSAAYGGVQQASQPHGLLSTAQNVATSFLGPAGVAVDTAIDSVVGGKRAADTLGALNDQYGTDFNDSLADNIGRQAAANTLGTVTSMGLSRFGADAGFDLAGINGARLGGLLGNAAGDQVGDMALSDPGSPTSPNPTDAGNTQPRGLLASATPTTKTTPAANYGPADFDGYASYAESFFG